MKHDFIAILAHQIHHPKFQRCPQTMFVFTRFQGIIHPGITRVK
jgi:hypothetical protein